MSNGLVYVTLIRWSLDTAQSMNLFIGFSKLVRDGVRPWLFFHQFSLLLDAQASSRCSKRTRPDRFIYFPAIGEPSIMSETDSRDKILR